MGGHGQSGLGCLLGYPGPFLRKELRLRPAHYSHSRLAGGEGSPASAFFLPLRLGRPLTHLGALGRAGGAGLSWMLVFLQGTSHGTSAEPSRIQGGRSAAAAAESLACSWPWQGCSHGEWTALKTRHFHPYLLPFLSGPPRTTGTSAAALLFPKALPFSATAPHPRTVGISAPQRLLAASLPQSPLGCRGSQPCQLRTLLSPSGLSLQGFQKWEKVGKRNRDLGKGSSPKSSSNVRAFGAPGAWPAASVLCGLPSLFHGRWGCGMDVWW